MKNSNFFILTVPRRRAGRRSPATSVNLSGRARRYRAGMRGAAPRSAAARQAQRGSRRKPRARVTISAFPSAMMFSTCVAAGNHPDYRCGDAGILSNALGEGHLVFRCDGDDQVFHQAAARTIDPVATAFLQFFRESGPLVDIPASLDPAGARHAHAQGLARWPGRAHWCRAHRLKWDNC